WLRGPIGGVLRLWIVGRPVSRRSLARPPQPPWAAGFETVASATSSPPWRRGSLSGLTGVARLLQGPGAQAGAMVALAPSPAPPRRPLAPRVDAATRLGTGALLWLGLLLPTYWWVADGGLQDLGGWESGLTSLGRISGLVASVLLLAQVI